VGFGTSALTPQVASNAVAAGPQKAMMQERSITVAFHEALAAHHDLRLVLKAGGIWSVQPIPIERPVT
jgi:hypothetical protein